METSRKDGQLISTCPVNRHTLLYVASEPCYDSTRRRKIHLDDPMIHHERLDNIRKQMQRDIGNSHSKELI